MSPPSLSHVDPTASDERLASESASHLARYPALQLVAELLTRLREMSFPWWTPDQLRQAYPATDRMKWLVRRSDIRQRITTQLTGLAPKAARNKMPDFQASLIDSVIDEGDITVDAFENAFEPIDLAVYGPAADFWNLFRKRMPWDDDATPHQDLVGWLIGALLAEKSSLDGAPRTPILGAVQVRMAIDGRVWHSRIPLHVRVAIDDARFAHQRERPQEPYGVDRDLQIATPALIAASIPLKDLGGVLDVAGQAMGFDEPQLPGGSRSFGRESSTPRPHEIAAEPTEDGPRTATSGPPPGAGPLPNLADVLESSAPEIEVAAHDTSEPGPDSDVPDELEHTNPWAVVAVAGESAPPPPASEPPPKPKSGKKK